jgi:MFS family permease
MKSLTNQPPTAATPTRNGRLLACLAVAVVGYQVNATMVSPALPDIISRLHTNTDMVGLSQTLFFLFAAIGQVTIARLSDYRGRRTMMLFSLGLLALGEIMTIAAPDIGVFIAGRILQGTSGATFTLAFLLLRDCMTPGQFGRAVGVITAINGGVGGFDTILGGSIADSIGFRGIFAVSLVITVAGTAGVLRSVPKALPVRDGRMDWPGIVALAIGLTGILVALAQGGSWGWTDGRVLALFIIGIISLVGFVLIEKRTSDPVVSTRVLGSRHAWPLLLATFATLAGVYGALGFTVPIFSQLHHVGYGMSATESALIYSMPAAAIGFLVAPFAGHLAPRLGWRRLLVAASVASLAALVIATVALDSQWLVFAMLVILGVTYSGIGLTALNGLAVVLTPADSPGSLPGINGACFGVGASAGIAIASALIAGNSPGGHPTLGAYTAAMWSGAVLAALAVVAVLLMRTVSRGTPPAS